MKFRSNRPLRDRGIYKLLEHMLIASKQSEELTFLFTLENWQLRGPVEYRVSHGKIYKNGYATEWTDNDLTDTELTADPPRSMRYKSAKTAFFPPAAARRS